MNETDEAKKVVGWRTRRIEKKEEKEKMWVAFSQFFEVNWWDS